MSAPYDPKDSTYLKTEFLERLAHELRGPTGVTKGALDEIEHAMGTDSVELRSLLAMARRGLHRVLRAADVLQRTAQIEAGNLRLNKVPMNVAPLVTRAVRSAEELEPRRAVHVAIEASVDPRCTAAVDEEWVGAAILEIIRNAVRFGAREVQIETSVADGEVRVTVTDDGPGFSAPPPLRFEPHRGKGESRLALSLPMVMDIMAAHGGRIDIGTAPLREGREARGARVTLALPRYESPSMPLARGVMSREPADAPWHAIVADDDEDARFLIATALRRRGFAVDEVTNGRALLDEVGTAPSTRLFVVSDVGMPEIDGIDATIALRKVAPRMPILLVTAYADSTTMARAQGAGADRVLLKPVDMDDLLLAVIQLGPEPTATPLR